VEYVEAVINGAFNPETIIPRYQELHEMIRPYVVGPEGEITGYTHLRSAEDFDTALEELIQHTQNRYRAASEYLTNMR
jgi:hypothetical protein